MARLFSLQNRRKYGIISLIYPPEETMKAIMTVIGADRVGIIASISSLLRDMNVNILDLSQTIMDGVFTMTILVDTSPSSLPFEDIRDALVGRGEEEQLSIRIQRADIFTAMHRI